MDCSLSASSVHGISQARMLDWAAISFSRRSSHFRDQTQVSCISCTGMQILYHWATREALSINTLSGSRSVMSDSLWPHGLYSPRNSPGQNSGVDNLSLLQRIFPTQGSNPGVMHCRWILYQLSHKGRPLHWHADSLSLSHQGSSMNQYLKNIGYFTVVHRLQVADKNVMWLKWE